MGEILHVFEEIADTVITSNQVSLSDLYRCRSLTNPRPAPLGHKLTQNIQGGGRIFVDSGLIELAQQWPELLRG